MKLSTVRHFTGTPFSIECESVDNGPGLWASSKVSIFRDDVLIGKYLRNYPRNAQTTFYPFNVNDEWYALYSPHYTCTRVLKLFDNKIEDWCGEEPSSSGFCPVEFYVPSQHEYKDPDSTEFGKYKTDCIGDYPTVADFHKDTDGVLATNSLMFGFLSGCKWGDDHSFKLRYVDLSKVSDRIITIEERFGYAELPQRMSLRESIAEILYEDDTLFTVSVLQEHVHRIG